MILPLVDLEGEKPISLFSPGNIGVAPTASTNASIASIVLCFIVNFWCLSRLLFRGWTRRIFVLIDGQADAAVYEFGTLVKLSGYTGLHAQNMTPFSNAVP